MEEFTKKEVESMQNILKDYIAKPKRVSYNIGMNSEQIIENFLISFEIFKYIYNNLKDKELKKKIEMKYLIDINEDILLQLNKFQDDLSLPNNSFFNILFKKRFQRFLNR